MGLMTHLFLLALAIPETLAFAGISFKALRHPNGALPMSLHVEDMMSSTYKSLTTQIMDKLGLQQTDFTASYEADAWSWSNSPKTEISGTSLWLSEASPKYLTGASFCTQRSKHILDHGQLDENCYTINIWMGPSYDVPHMLLTFGQRTTHANDNDSSSNPTTTYSITADYVTRGATPLGSDPQMMDNYYGPEVVQAWSQAYSLPGARPLAPQEEFPTRILNSPVRIAVGHITSPQDVHAFVHNHIHRFLSWVSTAQPIMARARGSFNLRDDKLRQYYFKGEVAKNIARLGDDTMGLKIGAANTGPTAEAYVGGGS